MSYSQFQSTLSMRRATGAISSGLVQRAISIHALHEESDLCSYPSPSAVAISIHALHEESDRVHTTFDSKVLSLFQSTLSMRRATGQVTLPVSIDLISIHALHEESDLAVLQRSHTCKFQSTLSMRRATHSRHSRRHIVRDFNPLSP